MRDKKLILILSVITAIFIVIFFVLLFRGEENKTTQHILSTFPSDKEENSPTNTPIRITFQKNAVLLLNSITITPSLDYLQTGSEDNVYLTPKNGLKANTRYTIQVYFKNTKDSYTFSFKTGKITVGSPGPDASAYEQYENSVREKAPDGFLSNKVPHKEYGFSITSFYDEKYKQFSFAVVLLGENKEKSKSDLQKWLKSLKLTDQQIDSLHFVYISEAVANLKTKLPYFGTYFVLSYNTESDLIKAIIYQNTKTQGDKEFDAFLKENGVNSRSEINNLTVIYQ